jgi:hypothetical protein
MFDRFIRLAKAKQALRDRRFEDALRLAADPLIENDRRAEQVRKQAADHLRERAQQKLADGDTAGARAELVLLRGRTEAAACGALEAAIEAAESGEAKARELARSSLAEVRRLLDRGETAAATALLSTVSANHLLLERQQLEQLVAERRRQGAALAAQALSALQDGASEVALERLLRAGAMDRDGAEIARCQQRILTAAAATAAAAVCELRQKGDVLAAVERFRGVAGTPAVRNASALVELRAELEAEVLAQLQRADSIDAALPLARAVLAADLASAEPLRGLTAAVLAAEPRVGRPEAGAAAALEAAARNAGAEGLARMAAAIASAGASRQQRLLQAQQLRDGGQLDAARALLVEFLVDEPMHEAARRELDLVDQGLADLDRRLAAVRAALREGRLREACTQALGLVGSARVAKEAQQVVAEARARMLLVERGLDEVRVALYGRVASSQEGVRHCLLRLEELAKVQADHEEIPKVVKAVTVEIEALAACERVSSALDRRAVDEVISGLAALVDLRERLLACDRLDARVCALADRLAEVTELALVGGRLAEVQRCADLFAKLQVVRPEFETKASALRQRADARRQAAGELVQRALASLAERDLAEAERLAEQAQQQWAEGSEVRALVEQLVQVRRQSDTLDRVETLTRGRDFHGAQQKLAEMPPTQQFLRTRIFDMKQNLARAQGLEGAFLLRADEGGEHLVVRGETVSIGNVRQTRADLPVLANIAGRHASIRRSMSFHGGMQDTIVAEEGEVRVGGDLVTSRSLAPGDRVQLGPAFGFVYQRPSARSLSVGLVLRGGFQIAGTDRVFLMKDRGRDGRILLGPTQDVHVRVPKATGEVEVFATNTGQMRVFCEAGGTIDGVPFRGEHPLAAGQIVAAAGISFLLLPWRPTV